MKKVFLLIALPLVLLLGACSASKQTAATTTTTTTTPSNVAQRTVVEIAENSPEYSTLIEAVNTVGLDETLNGPGPFTVFAPTDAAFAKLAEDMNWNEESQDRDQMDRMNTDSTNRMQDIYRDTMMQNRQDTSMYNRNWNNTRDTMMQNPQDTSMYNRNWNTMRDTMMQNQNMQNRTWNTTRDTMMQNQNMQNRTYNNSYRSDTIPGRYNNNVDQKTSAVLSPENQANLKTILQYHVVRGNYTPETLRQAIQAGNGKTELTTVQGEKLTVTLQGNDFVLQDARGAQARITTPAQEASNGVVYRIDQVILPDNESIRNR